ncbi:enoyl-CoA hydratase/isomerase family protein [Streptomyces sp. NPDC007205]|uniref:enoyl-CoA hydratase/isomerase family protein n=1 Tax=Streptomyces sp. NPDC007205 TaxID=3154316 RepID=UPI0033F80A6F
MAVELTVQDSIADIVLNRPDKRNAMTQAMYHQLADAFAYVRDDEAIRVAVLRGSTPEAFCAGADLTEAAPGLTEGHFDISEWDGAHLKNMNLFKPVIAAVDGYCLGGGLEIMLGTDIRIAASTAVFGLPEAGVGLVPAGGTLTRLVRQIPYAHAMDLLLTGRRIDAAEAYAIGLISTVVDPADLVATAHNKAAALAQLSQQSLRVIKESVLRLSDLPLSAALHAEAVYGQKAFLGKEAAEGLAAFSENRPPNFGTPSPGRWAPALRQGAGTEMKNS